MVLVLHHFHVHAKTATTCVMLSRALSPTTVLTMPLFVPFTINHNLNVAMHGANCTRPSKILFIATLSLLPLHPPSPS